jgi:two-component system, OmpR family, response regulator MprA
VAVGPRVLVVDDEAPVRLSLRRALELESYEVECVESGTAALDHLRLSPVDVVVLDVSMPGIDGLETCRALRERGDTVPVLLLTARSRMIDTVVGLDSGADDYLAKPFDLDVLYARLRSLLRRASGSVAGVLRLGDLAIDTRTHRVQRSGVWTSLSPRECELLSLLVARAGEVLEREWIIEQLWGLNVDVSANSLDVCVASLRRKIDGNEQDRIIHTVRGVGYVARLRREVSW